MPKITDERRLERRTQYLDAARRCFSRTGIAATRMEDITAEAGLSSGSTYLYFSSKDELIRAAIDASLVQFEDLIAEITASAGGSTHELVEALLSGVDGFRSVVQGVDIYSLAIQGWAFAQNDDEAHQMIRESFERMVHGLAEAIAVREASKSADPLTAAHVLGSLILGLVVQQAFTGSTVVKSEVASIDTLVSLLATESQGD